MQQYTCSGHRPIPTTTPPSTFTSAAWDRSVETTVPPLITVDPITRPPSPLPKYPGGPGAGPRSCRPNQGQVCQTFPDNSRSFRIMLIPKAFACTQAVAKSIPASVYSTSNTGLPAR